MLIHENQKSFRKISNSLGLQRNAKKRDHSHGESIHQKLVDRLNGSQWLLMPPTVVLLYSKIKHCLVHLIRLKPPPNFIGSFWFLSPFLLVIVPFICLYAPGPQVFKPTIFDAAWRLKHMSIFCSSIGDIKKLQALLVFTYEPLLITIHHHETVLTSINHHINHCSPLLSIIDPYQPLFTIVNHY